jgi:hypothetical protein
MEQKEAQQEKTEKTERKKFINYAAIVGNVPYMLFLGFLAVLYIYNGHLADKLSRQIGKTERNVKELEYEYKTIKSEVIYRSKASELIKAVEPIGLKELKEAPILIKDTTINEEKQ